MLVPAGTNKKIIEIKKSRFIAIAEPVSTQEVARERLKAAKEEFVDATHVVHAFLTGPGADIFGFSDDREPSGTAGRPVLEVLKGSGITNIIVLVVRYFGGIKLGTGGLVKAYTESAKAALEGLEVEELIERTAFTVGLPYTHFEQIQKILLQNESVLEEPEFGTDIIIKGKIPAARLPAARGEIMELTAGNVDLIPEKTGNE